MGPDDDQIELTTKEDVDASDSAVVLVPPQVKSSYLQAVFRLFKAEYLPKMDSWGTCDGFVSCKFHEFEIKTNIVKMKDRQLWWNQEIHLAVRLPVVSERLILKVWDSDTGGDQIIGAIHFNNRKIQKIGKNVFFWANIYGAPIDASGADADKANHNPEHGTCWKGRILMQVDYWETEEPKREITTIAEPLIRQGEKIHKFKYELLCDIIQGVMLPENEEYKIQIGIGEHVFEHSDIEGYNNLYLRWNARFNKKFQNSYASLKQFPDLFIYLCLGNKRVCYKRLKAKDYGDKNAQLEWIQMSNDKAVGLVDHPLKAGFILVSF